MIINDSKKLLYSSAPAPKESKVTSDLDDEVSLEVSENG